MRTKKSHSCILLPGALAIALAGCFSVEAAVLVSEPFDGSAAGWTDAGSMTVNHTGLDGNAAGSLEGEFASQGLFFVPQTGSFRMDVGGSSFLGAYPGGDNLTGFTFDFRAPTVTPLDVNLRLFSGLDVYFYTLDISALGSGWTPFSVSLSSPNWQGNAGVLGNVTAIELQVARGSAAQQFYYLDNFSTTQQDFGGGGGGSAVPEPSSLGLMLVLGVVLHGLRRWTPLRRPDPGTAL